MNQYKNNLGSLANSLAFIDSIDERDGCGRGHSRRVSLLATRLAESTGADEQVVANIRLGGLLHDVGKASIPQGILSKPGRLNDDEYRVMQQHPRLGYELLRDIPGLEAILPGVLHHHERFDGGGYPSGLRENEIPQIARILSISDAFDAMTSPRCYRVACSCDQALTELKAESGGQFDPALVEAFLKIDLEEFSQDVETFRLHPRRRAA
ncbi:MAG: HD-GYP domain-containing protein [Pyrinomonadaceae bacterium]|nr:HD-GYP domain-containing protein [Phycisphaerales bacterium]